jgi:glutamate N-acetyltransferase/amino-acid N-acetyltransferase
VTNRCTGFRFAGVSSGIKADGSLDLGLIYSDRPTTAAAVFTQNRAAAAPVLLSKAQLRKSGGKARALIVNSGNANAITGQQGKRDGRSMIAQTADQLGVPREEVLVSSTGVIGVPLPMTEIGGGIASACDGHTGGGFRRFARAILTTDKSAKIASRRVAVGGKRVTLLGCTKGAGMIAPNMATTLTFVVTDARLGSRALDQSLREAVAPTFNAITVDGDTSTNDMVLLMANGGAGGSAVRAPDARRFTKALTGLLDELARKLMRDGEGVHHVVEVLVRGASSDAAAQRVAQTVANSPLVKTAIAGCDPNWGRILAAAGRAGVRMKVESTSLRIGSVPVLTRGEPSSVEGWDTRASRIMARREYPLVLDLGLGKGVGRYLACDLSHDYVSINADYRT